MTRTTSISRLYSKHPDIYDVIAQDRNFYGQIIDLKTYLQLESFYTLELCAGHARHSLALYTIKNDPKAIACIDSSQAMHDYAVNKVYIGDHGFDEVIPPLSEYHAYVNNINMDVTE